MKNIIIQSKRLAYVPLGQLKTSIMPRQASAHRNRPCDSPTTVYSAQTQLVLPSTLSGDYEVELVMGNWLFTGWINL